MTTIYAKPPLPLLTTCGWCKQSLHSPRYFQEVVSVRANDGNWTNVHIKCDRKQNPGQWR